MPIQDYHPGEYEPIYLTREQIADPYIVIDELFDYAHLPELRAQLWEWIRLTITCSYHEQEVRDKVNLLYCYDQIVKMIEAVHLLHRKTEERKFEGEEK